MVREFSVIRNIPIRAIALEVVQRRPTGTDRGWIERYIERLESPEWDFERDDKEASPPVVVGPIKYPEKGFLPEYSKEDDLPTTEFGKIAFVGDIAYVGNVYGHWIKLPIVEDYFLLPDGNHRISAAILLKMESYPVVRHLKGSYVEALDYASSRSANRGSDILFYAPEKGSGSAKVLCKFENHALREIWWRRLDIEIAAECGVSAPIVKSVRDRFLSTQPIEEQKRLIESAAIKVREDGTEVRTDFRGRRSSKEKPPVVHPSAPLAATPPITIRLNPGKTYQSPSQQPKPPISTAPRESATENSGKIAKEVRTVLEDFNLKDIGELKDRLGAYNKLQEELEQTVEDLQGAWDEIDRLKKQLSQYVRLAG